MKRVRLLALLLVATVTVATVTVAAAASAQEALRTERTIALTIDDLPVAGTHPLAWTQRVTRDLLAQIDAAGVPAIGFVNERRLDVAGEVEARTALLRAWVDAGLALGNHTYSHRSLFDTPLDTFTADVARGQRVTARLLAARGDSVRYFRHPYLHTGPDAATRDAFVAWLGAHGLAVAPVTQDNADYLYAAAYDRALADGDTSLQVRIATAYLAFTDTTAAYYEALSRDLFGREPAQVLLVHANALHAATLGAVVDLYRRRGYRFVTLDAALADDAYQSADTYAGRAGMSWLQRWAIARRVRFTSEPVADAWVEALAGGR